VNIFYDRVLLEGGSREEKQGKIYGTGQRGR
jgi:hypothetical protein